MIIPFDSWARNKTEEQFTLKHMGKFSISLYMFFSFCRATAASSNLGRQTLAHWWVKKENMYIYIQIKWAKAISLGILSTWYLLSIPF